MVSDWFCYAASLLVSTGNGVSFPPVTSVSCLALFSGMRSGHWLTAPLEMPKARAVLIVPPKKPITSDFLAVIFLGGAIIFRPLVTFLNSVDDQLSDINIS